MPATAGIAAVRDIGSNAAVRRQGPDACISFSLENWKRPEDEISGLMSLSHRLPEQRAAGTDRQNVACNWAGAENCRRRAGGEDEALRRRGTARADPAPGPDYGGAGDHRCRGALLPARSSKAHSSPSRSPRKPFRHLYTAGAARSRSPDSNGRRVARLQLSVVADSVTPEIHVTQKYWPEFGCRTILHTAIRDYANRSRRYGAVDETNS